jgi:hypothetical protein
MKNKRIIIAAAATLLTVLVATLSIALNNSLKNEDMSEGARVAKTVCAQYANNLEESWRKACGDLQEATNTEYICEGGGAESYCWMEKK